VIRTTERRIERDRDRLANLQGLLADREKQLDAIPRKRRLNQLGFVGVTARSSRRFMAMLHLFGRKYYCGIHETPEQAAAAIEAKRAELKREKT
jgi:hypothetical protein